MVVAVAVPADVSSSSGGPYTGGGSAARRRFRFAATTPAATANPAPNATFSAFVVNTIFVTKPPTGENTNAQIGSHCQ